MKGIILGLLLVMMACSDDQQKQKIADAELLKWAVLEGDRITAQAQAALGGRLKQAISEGGPAYAVEFCHLSAANILDSLSTTYNDLEVRRTTLKPRNPLNSPTELEQGLLLQYQQGLQQQSEIAPHVVEIDDNQLLYSKPILLNNPLCLNCHGDVQNQISNETYQVIQQHYPTDQAINFKLGELRGMWSIKFNREEITSHYLQSLKE